MKSFLSSLWNSAPLAPFRILFATTNGRKSVIGCVLLLLSMLATSGLPPFIPPLGPLFPLLAHAAPIMATVGGWMGGVGLFHKVIKLVFWLADKLGSSAAPPEDAA